MKKIAVFPGSFSPFTFGHKSIVERTLPLFDKLIIAIGINSNKNYMFSLAQRKKFIEEWHQIIVNQKLELLDNILDDNVVFSSPVVFSPLEGKNITKMYLFAAGKAFNMSNFRYTREVHDEHNSILEFETLINGISVKSHGNANPYAFSCAINNCYDFILNNLNKKIIENFKS